MLTRCLKLIVLLLILLKSTDKSYCVVCSYGKKRRVCDGCVEIGGEMRLIGNFFFALVSHRCVSSDFSSTQATSDTILLLAGLNYIIV